MALAIVGQLFQRSRVVRAAVVGDLKVMDGASRRDR